MPRSESPRPSCSAGGGPGFFCLIDATENEIPLLSLDLDWRVTAFAFALSVATGILFGLAPALHGSRVDVNTILKSGTGMGATGFRQNRLRAALVIASSL